MDTVVKEELGGVKDSSSLNLTASDRCDAANCGAQARARVLFDTGMVILFCRHHAEVNRESLTSKGFVLETQYEGL